MADCLEHQSIFTDLLFAVMAVNNWPLEKVGVLLPQLILDDLVNPFYLSSADAPLIFIKLKEAGYNRPDFVV